MMAVAGIGARLLVFGMGFLVFTQQVQSQVVQAENVTVMEGETAEITCRLHSYDGSIVVIQNPYRQTLFFNGTRALKDERFQLVSFTHKQLRIALSDIRVEDEGGYYCQLYSEDTHHQVAVVTVLVLPEPIVEVKGEEPVENGEVELICTVPRSKPPARIRWFRDKKLLQVPPTVKVQPPSVLLREGDDLTLTCSVTGNPQPADVMWSRLNDSLPSRAKLSGNLLTITALTTVDNGTYVCEAENELGRTADEYVLVVYDPGAVVEPQTSVSYAVVGGVLAVFVFAIICVLTVTVCFSMRQKGSYLTHEASGLDEHGEAREAFINGNESHERKKEYFI
ncbi:cell adhesion molecule 4 isoform X3 [Carcharodon carcharias]|uniref:cell adhesion molecule 4 isoform X3 n=1 Tax=Carcharodon carcharias TaxID=13397 RepID=UPI001B7E14D7|nr:cell adhesion molecule 4 isoform X3 [Carcharodon carcharias]